VVEEFGADALRMFEMFMGPLEAMKPWNTKGIIGVVRFLERAWKYCEKWEQKDTKEDRDFLIDRNITINKDIEKEIKNYKENRKLLINSNLNITIDKVTQDIENFHFNTAISQLMVFVDFIEEESKGSLAVENFLILLAPFAPHFAEELWEKLGHKESIFLQSWPIADEKYLKKLAIEMVVQINGKLRDRIWVTRDITEDKAKEVAFKSEKIKAILQGKEIKRVIFVKGGRLLSIVI
jgi:leucyl-tRNA synthetase